MTASVKPLVGTGAAPYGEGMTSTPPTSSTPSTSPSAPATASGSWLSRTAARVVAWALTLRVVRTLLLYVERRGPFLADAVTYRALFSVFAGLLLGFSLAGLWLNGDPQALEALIGSVQAAVPGLVGDDGIVDVQELTTPLTLSIAGVVSAGALVGSALGAIGSLRTAVRLLAGTAQTDVLWIWVILRNVALAVGIGVSFVLAATLTVLGQRGLALIGGALGIDDDSPVSAWGVRVVSLVIVFALDTVLIAAVFRLLSGVRAVARSLWGGAVRGGLGLVVLQELSGLFVGGAASNPLLASFASLLALLIWLNLSTQVMLVACAYIVTSEDERTDRVRARFGATTFAQRRVRRAEADVEIATAELRAAQQAASDQ